MTLLEGEASVVDGARAAMVALGLALKAQALIETQAGTKLLRIEFPDGSIADLGPQTRVMVEPAGFASRGGKTPLLYLLSGWVKLASPSSSSTAGLTSPELDLPPFTGTVVMQAAPKLHRVFVEAGQAEVIDRQAAASRNAVASGQMVVAGSGGVVPRPSADFLTAMPRMFRDRIPSQAARLKDTVVDAAPLPGPSYTTLRDWLTAEPAIRRDFPRRFAELARTGPFRSSLEAGLALHPEWKPVLYPPLPRPKPP